MLTLPERMGTTKGWKEGKEGNCLRKNHYRRLQLYKKRVAVKLTAQRLILDRLRSFLPLSLSLPLPVSCQTPSSLTRPYIHVYVRCRILGLHHLLASQCCHSMRSSPHCSMSTIIVGIVRIFLTCFVKRRSSSSTETPPDFDDLKLQAQLALHDPSGVSHARSGLQA